MGVDHSIMNDHSALCMWYLSHGSPLSHVGISGGYVGGGRS